MQEKQNKGRILRVKHGYNPNSSSMGSIIFALPVSMAAVSFGLAAVSAAILPFFIKEPPQGADMADQSKDCHKEAGHEK